MITKKEYTEYLISTRCNYTCSNLAEHRAKTSHDAVSNFLKREKITPSSVWNMVKLHILDGAAKNINVVREGYNETTSLVAILHGLH